MEAIGSEIVVRRIPPTPEPSTHANINCQNKALVDGYPRTVDEESKADGRTGIGECFYVDCRVCIFEIHYRSIATRYLAFSCQEG